MTRARTTVVAGLLVAAALAPVSTPAQGRRSGAQPGQGQPPRDRAEPPERTPIPDAAPRTFEVRVTEKGFEPALITVRKGERVKLVFLRETDATCAKTLVIDEFLVWNKLPLRERFATTFTTGRTGEFPYTCPTRETQGIIRVEDGPPGAVAPPAAAPAPAPAASPTPPTAPAPPAKP